MDTKYINAKDINVGSYIVYGKSADSKIYLESDFKTQVPVEDAKDAFMKGLLIIMVGTVAYVPVSNDGVKFTTVSYSSSAVSGKDWSAKAAS